MRPVSFLHSHLMQVVHLVKPQGTLVATIDQKSELGRVELLFKGFDARLLDWVAALVYLGTVRAQEDPIVQAYVAWI